MTEVTAGVMNNARESNIPNDLTQTDDVFLSGGGFAARYRFFERWPLTLRVAAGLGRGIAGPPGAIAVLVPNTVAPGVFGGASGTTGGPAVMLPLSAGVHLDF